MPSRIVPTPSLFFPPLRNNRNEQKDTHRHHPRRHQRHRL